MIITKNPRGDRPIEVPIKANGDLYTYEMICDGLNTRVYADTPDELVAALIDGYAELDTDQAAQARLEYAVTQQVRIQATLPGLEYNLAELDQNDRDVILGSRATPPIIQRWDHTIPLVLVTTFYDRYHGELPTPDGNIIWLDPTDDLTLITTLAKCGQIHIAAKTPKATS